ncbi:ribonuclease G [Lachnospiraceae bacterium NE2001]|nr:ribonuclease G [Lachnospiraceae bacterium NE2001]
MEAKYVITELNDKKTGFLLEDGKLVKACLLSNESLVGNIYTAKVINIVPSINAAFLDAGTGDTLYYSLSDNEGKHIFLKHGNTDKVCIGDELLVQVSMDPIKTKKGSATSILELKGRYIILKRNNSVGFSKKFVDEDRKNVLRERVKNVIESEMGSYSKIGALIRTAANDVSDEIILEEVKELAIKMNSILNTAQYSVAKNRMFSAPLDYIEDLLDIIAKNKYGDFKIVTDLESEYDLMFGIIDSGYLELYNDEMISLSKVYNLEDKLKKGFNRTIYLKSGGSIVVEPTEALTVIDVNTGKAIKGKDVQKTFLKINIEAAKEIARILRLRNISGIIIIDFISMKDAEDIRELIGYLKSYLSYDEKRVTYVDMTPLGLVELTRVKGERPLTLADFS